MSQARYILTLKTALSGRTVEQLLEAACTRPRQVTLEGIEKTPSGERKVIRISFEIEQDRERFRMELRKLASAAPAPTSREAKA